MKKVLALLLTLCLVLSLAAACSKKEENNNTTPTPDASRNTEKTTDAPKDSETKKDDSSTTTSTPEPTPTDVPVDVIEDKDEIKELTNGQLVDGKFPEKKHITVEVYDRDGGTPTNDNMLQFPVGQRQSRSTTFLQQTMLLTFAIHTAIRQFRHMLKWMVSLICQST